MRREKPSTCAPIRAVRSRPTTRTSQWCSKVDALVVSDRERLGHALDLENRKYGTDYGVEMLDPEHNTWFEFRPAWAFALDEDDFTGTPTRWSFARETAQ